MPLWEGVLSANITSTDWNKFDLLQTQILYLFYNEEDIFKMVRLKIKLLKSKKKGKVEDGKLVNDCRNI